MNWLDLPSLNSLRAFALVAETGSFKRAAEKINVTHAAVSQQVKALEKHLEVALVMRSGRGIELTDDGLTLARELHRGFDTISYGVKRLMHAGVDRPVQITMSPAFAVEWLMPKIPEFQIKNPGITLLLNPTAKIEELRLGGTDVAIRYCDRRRSRPDITPVLVSDMIVVAAPQLIGDRHVSDPADLLDFPWLQELGTNEALDWFTYHGISPDRTMTIHSMPGSLIMGAVRRGDGITYTARAFFKKDLETGAMIELFSEPEFGFYFVESQKGPQRSSVRTFLNWLRSKSETTIA